MLSFSHILGLQRWHNRAYINKIVPFELKSCDRSNRIVTSQSYCIFQLVYVTGSLIRAILINRSSSHWLFWSTSLLSRKMKDAQDHFQSELHLSSDHNLLLLKILWGIHVFKTKKKIPLWYWSHNSSKKFYTSLVQLLQFDTWTFVAIFFWWCAILQICYNWHS